MTQNETKQEQTRKQKYCEVCGKPIERKGNNVKYCSMQCARKKDRNLQKISKRAAAMDGWRAVICWIYDSHCALCGWRGCDEITEINGKTQFSCLNQVHHIIPVSEGGTESVENLIMLCPNHHKMADLGIISKESLLEKTKAAMEKYESIKMYIDSPKTFKQYWTEWVCEQMKKNKSRQIGLAWEDIQTEGYHRGLLKGWNKGYDEGWDSSVNDFFEKYVPEVREKAKNDEEMIRRVLLSKTEYLPKEI